MTTSPRPQISLLALPLLCTLALHAQNVRATPLHTTHCLRDTPLACPSDLRTEPLSGPGLHGYTDPRSHLFLDIKRAFAGRVTMDEGCSRATPQYQLYLHVLIRNPLRHRVTFDLVGLTVQDQRGRTYTPFGWGWPGPSHAQPLGVHRSREVWLPYFIARPTSLTVRWQYIYPNHATSPTVLVQYRVERTGIRACRAR